MWVEEARERELLRKIPTPKARKSKVAERIETTTKASDLSARLNLANPREFVHITQWVHTLLVCVWATSVVVVGGKNSLAADHLLLF